MLSLLPTASVLVDHSVFTAHIKYTKCSRCVEGPKFIVVLSNTNNLLINYKDMNMFK
jgi:hypothetical protein